MSKYHSTRTQYNGITYDSKREATRAEELDWLLRAGKIGNLQRQYPYELIPALKNPHTGKTERAVSYVADFVYTRDGKVVVEDVKGFRTPEFIIKRKLMAMVYDIWVEEVQ